MVSTGRTDNRRRRPLILTPLCGPLFVQRGLQYCRSCPTEDFSRFELASAIALSLMCSLRTAVRAWLDYEARLDVSLTALPILKRSRSLFRNHARLRHRGAFQGSARDCDVRSRGMLAPPRARRVRARAA